MPRELPGLSEPPRKAPKSFVVIISAGLVGLLCAGPLIFGAYFLGLKALLILGQLIFALCWVIAAAHGIIFAFGLITGRYRDMQESDWKEQIG